MTKQARQKAQVVTILSLVALVSVLLYTFWHTGALLSRYISPSLFGYIAAGGIEVTVIAMSVQFRDILASPARSSFTKGLFVFVFLAALAVSAFANMSEGFRTEQGKEFTSATLGNVDWLVAVIGVSATGLLSLVVMSLAELLGDSFNVVLGIASDLSRPERPMPVVNVQHANMAVLTQPGALPLPPPVTGGSLDAAREQRRLDATEAVQALVAFLAEHPRATQAEAGRAVSRSRTWVSKRLQELERQGAIARSGDGVRVVSSGDR